MQVDAEFISLPAGIRVDDSESISDAFEPLQDVEAVINGDFGHAFSSAGVFGNVGMRGQQLLPGAMETEVVIESKNENVNFLPVARRAHANFIIDGGSLGLVGEFGSTVTYDISIHFDMWDPFNNPIGNSSFVSRGTLLSHGFTSPATLATSGDDIGTRLLPSGFGAEIPLSFHSIDLGLIPTRGQIDIRYTANFRSFATSFEGAGWTFSDPGSIGGTGEFPTITFTTVPEPRGIVLWGLGLAALAACARMRPSFH
jgi:hypothetical protein